MNWLWRDATGSCGAAWSPTVASPGGTGCVSHCSCWEAGWKFCRDASPGAHSLCRNPSFLRWPERAFSLSLGPVLLEQPRGSRHSTASTAKHSFPCLDKKILFSSPCNFNTAFWCYTTRRPSYTRHTHAHLLSPIHPSLECPFFSLLPATALFQGLMDYQNPNNSNINNSSQHLYTTYYLANFFLLNVRTTCTFP